MEGSFDVIWSNMFILLLIKLKVRDAKWLERGHLASLQRGWDQTQGFWAAVLNSVHSLGVLSRDQNLSVVYELTPSNINKMLFIPHLGESSTNTIGALFNFLFIHSPGLNLWHPVFVGVLLNQSICLFYFFMNVALNFFLNWSIIDIQNYMLQVYNIVIHNF